MKKTIPWGELGVEITERTRRGSLYRWLQCLSVFFKIILPTVKPALATQFVLISMNTWNEFFVALVFAGRENMRPLTVGLLDFFTSIGVAHWGLIGAAMIMTSIPTILIYSFGNKQIENALTAGAVLK